MGTDHKHAWETYIAEELEALRPILTSHGYTLDDNQLHTKGERYLQQAVTTTSGKKLILLGAHSSGTRVVIKATRDPQGIRELEHEEVCRSVLHAIDFAGDVFETPEVLENVTENDFRIRVTRFIDQPGSFLERPIEEQFVFALRAFKAQESAHATTFNHRKLIGDTFGMRDAETYLTTFASFVHRTIAALPDAYDLSERLHEAHRMLTAHERTIEQYCDFLTHTDFVPHNIRIEGDTIVLLDHSSLTFGNKYEGWARLLNFMTLYNPPLTDLLTQYVKDNRTPEESVALSLMRIYRLGEIIWYYARTLGESEGDLRTLNRARVTFWSTVLGHMLSNTPVPQSVVDNYKKTRDSLRSEDEKKRQQGLH